jgi:transposase
MSNRSGADPETGRHGRHGQLVLAQQARRAQAIEDAGATLLFLPPYGPDLKPIEQLFAKLKALLRAKALRTVEALWTALGSITECVSPQECQNFIRRAGYFRSS